MQLCLINSTEVALEARIKLAVWVAQTGKRKSEAAKMLGLHPATLSQFLSGKQKPGPKAKLLIEANTNTEVSAKDWE